MVEQLAVCSPARAVVITLVEGGVAGWDRTRYYREPALPVRIVDRIRAGDALAALVLGQDSDMVVTTREEQETLAAAPGRDVIK